MVEAKVWQFNQPAQQCGAGHICYCKLMSYEQSDFPQINGNDSLM